MEDVLLEVPLDSIRISPFQPRRRFAEKELKQLADSIDSIGLIHPPVVREILNKGKHLYYELITGERRWRAMQLLRRLNIQVLIRKSEDICAAEAALAENLQRVDLNPIETAEAFKKFMDIFQLTQDKLAVKVGKKRSTIANYLRLLTLSEEIKNLLMSGELTMGHAKILLSLDSENKRKSLKDAIIRNKLAVRQAEDMAKRLNSQGGIQAPVVLEKQVVESDQTTENNARKFINFLERQLPVEVAFSSVDPAGGGTFTLSYKESSDLEEILYRISNWELQNTFS